LHYLFPTFIILIHLWEVNIATPPGIEPGMMLTHLGIQSAVTLPIRLEGIVFFKHKKTPTAKLSGF